MTNRRALLLLAGLKKGVLGAFIHARASWNPEAASLLQ